MFWDKVKNSIDIEYIQWYSIQAALKRFKAFMHLKSESC